MHRPTGASTAGENTDITVTKRHRREVPVDQNENGAENPDMHEHAGEAGSPER
jgi:hypothetical protein